MNLFCYLCLTFQTEEYSYSSNAKKDHSIQNESEFDFAWYFENLYFPKMVSSITSVTYHCLKFVMISWSGFCLVWLTHLCILVAAGVSFGLLGYSVRRRFVMFGPGMSCISLCWFCGPQFHKKTCSFSNFWHQFRNYYLPNCWDGQCLHVRSYAIWSYGWHLIYLTEVHLCLY